MCSFLEEGACLMVSSMRKYKKTDCKTWKINKIVTTATIVSSGIG